jgi:hypothetical protein
MSWFDDNMPTQTSTPGTYTGGGQYPLASVMGQGLMQPWTTPYVAPTQGPAVTRGADPTRATATMAEVSADPGFAFRLQEGLKAIQRSAAAKGTALSGGTMKALERYGQDYSSNEYGNAYNRARSAFENDRNFNEGQFQTDRGFGENRFQNDRNFNEGQYASAYGRAAGEYSNAQNTFYTNQNNQFNRLQTLSNAGQNAAGAYGNLASGYGNQTSDLTTGSGNAGASGTVGGYNAWAAALANIANYGSQAVAAWLAKNPAPRSTAQTPGTYVGPS